MPSFSPLLSDCSSSSCPWPIFIETNSIALYFPKAISKPLNLWITPALGARCLAITFMEVFFLSLSLLFYRVSAGETLKRTWLIYESRSLIFIFQLLIYRRVNVEKGCVDLFDDWVLEWEEWVTDTGIFRWQLFELFRPGSHLTVGNTWSV